MAGFGYGGAGSFMDGWNKEEERVSNSRADKRRKLQEMMDLAAQQGRPITSLDEMLSMSSEVGADMTHSMLEQMRETHNSKAKEAEAKRRYEAATRDDEMSERIKKKALDMYASGKTPLAISEGLRQVYPENAVKIVMEQWDGVASSYEAQEYAKGIQHASTIDTEDEAKEHAKRMGLTEKATEGLMSAVRNKFKNSELKAMEWAASQGARLDRNDPAGFKAGVAEIVSNLPAALQPHAKTVESFLKSGGMQGQVAVQRRENEIFTQATANALGGAAQTTAIDTAREPAQRREAADKAEWATREEATKGRSMAAAQFAAMAGPKSKEPEEVKARLSLLAGAVSSIDMPQETINSLASLAMKRGSEGEKAFREELARAGRLGVSADMADRLSGVRARVRLGDLGTERLNEAVTGASIAYWQAGPAAALGAEAAAHKRNGLDRQFEQSVSAVVDLAASRLQQMRQDIAAGGVISASQAEADGVELAALTKWLESYAASAGLNPASLAARAYAKAGPAREYRKAPTPFDRGMVAIQGNSPLRQYMNGGGGAGFAAPAAPPQAQPAPAPTSGEYAALLQRELDGATAALRSGASSYQGGNIAQAIDGIRREAASRGIRLNESAAQPAPPAARPQQAQPAWQPPTTERRYPGGILGMLEQARSASAMPPGVGAVRGGGGYSFNGKVYPTKEAAIAAYMQQQR